MAEQPYAIINNWYPNRRANLPMGGTTYVSKTGSDATGQRGNIGRPYLTLTAAKNGALSGDTIVVFPGTYAENDLLKNGVNWFFMPGAIVSFVATSPTIAAFVNGTFDTIANDNVTTVYGIFDDRSSGAVTCTIGGYGSFYVENRGYNLLKGTLVVTNVSSNISLTGKEIGFAFFRDSGTETSGGSRAAVFVSNAAHVDVKVDRIYGVRGQTFNTGKLDTLSSAIIWADNGTGVYWQLGPLYVRTLTIEKISSYSVWGDQPIGNVTAAEMWVEADLIENHAYMDGGSSAGGATGTYNWKTWMIVKEIQESINYFDYGRHYLIAEKMDLVTSPLAIQGATQVWMQVQKITNTTAGNWITLAAGNPSGTGCPIVYVDVQQFEDVQGTFSTAGILVAGSATELHLLNAFFKTKAGNVNPAIKHSAGSTRITNCTIDTSATNNAGANPVLVAGAGCILDKCVLVSAALANSVGAAAPQTISSYGTMANQVMSTNITVQLDSLLLENIGRVTGSDATTTGQALVNITGLSVALIASGVFEFEAVLSLTTSADVTGQKFGVQFSAAGGAVEAQLVGSLTSTAAASERVSALNTATANAYMTTSAQSGQVLIKGIATTGVNAGNLTIQFLKVTSGTATVRINSFLKARRIA